ncbi:MAG TPA: hypothetical protein VMV90_10160 [Rectinemataceae bacterium]|nr:hypothetical protein [Rectinemataceae bacterium]
MANRFARKIKSGEIESIAELKSEFKAIAKLSHPDLLGPGADGGEFARLRQEYETAMADFERIRFGARIDRAEELGAMGDMDGARTASMPFDAWICLGLLLKRGFPKVPRHEKELLRYEYARWRLARSLGPERHRQFLAYEAELLAMKSDSSTALGSALDLLRSLIEYRGKGLPAMRTHIVLSLGALCADPRVGAGVRSFTQALARELGIGGEIGQEAGPDAGTRRHGAG